MADSRFYRFEDPIQNLSLRVRLRQVQPRRPRDEDIDEAFEWQEKVLGPAEILAYDDEKRHEREARGSAVGGAIATVTGLFRDREAARRLAAHRGDIERLIERNAGTGDDPKTAMLRRLRESGVFLYTYVDRDGFVPPSEKHRLVGADVDPGRRGPGASPLATAARSMAVHGDVVAAVAGNFAAGGANSGTASDASGAAHDIARRLAREEPCKVGHVMYTHTPLCVSPSVCRVSIRTWVVITPKRTRRHRRRVWLRTARSCTSARPSSRRRAASRSTATTTTTSSATAAGGAAAARTTRTPRRSGGSRSGTTRRCSRRSCSPSSSSIARCVGKQRQRGGDVTNAEIKASLFFFVTTLERDT